MNNQFRQIAIFITMILMFFSCDKAPFDCSTSKQNSSSETSENPSVVKVLRGGNSGVRMHSEHTYWPDGGGNYLIPGGNTTTLGPSGAYFNSKVYLFYKSSYIKCINTTDLNYGLTWSSPVNIGISYSEPTAAVFNNKLYVFYYRSYQTYWYDICFRSMNSAGVWSTEKSFHNSYTVGLQGAIGLASTTWGKLLVFYTRYVGVPLCVASMATNETFTFNGIPQDYNGTEVITSLGPSAVFVPDASGHVFLSINPKNLTDDNNEIITAMLWRYDSYSDLLNGFWSSMAYILSPLTNVTTGLGYASNEVIWIIKDQTDGQLYPFFSSDLMNWWGESGLGSWTLTSHRPSICTTPNQKFWIFQKGFFDQYLYVRIGQ